MRRTWKPIATTPPTHSAVELRFEDGSSDLALWTGTQWLPELDDRRAAQWRHLPIRFPLLDEFSQSPRPGDHAA